MRPLLATLFVATAALSQEHGEGSAAAHGAGDPWIWWKWANFAILAILLGYFAKKFLPPFFAGRTTEIQKGIADAKKLRKDADARASAIEQRMKMLGTQIEEMRAAAREEMAHESARIRRETESALARVRAQSEQEIQAAGGLARRELKAYAAQLAIDLAEQRIRLRLDATVESALIASFVRDLEGARN